MAKSICTPEYAEFLRLLRAARVGAGISQEEPGNQLGQTQSFVSKCERGERRLDIVELRQICLALGISFPRFGARLDKALEKKK